MRLGKYWNCVDSRYRLCVNRVVRCATTVKCDTEIPFNIQSNIHFQLLSKMNWNCCWSITTSNVDVYQFYSLPTKWTASKLYRVWKLPLGLILRRLIINHGRFVRQMHSPVKDCRMECSGWQVRDVKFNWIKSQSHFIFISHFSHFIPISANPRMCRNSTREGCVRVKAEWWESLFIYWWRRVLFYLLIALLQANAKCDVLSSFEWETLWLEETPFWSVHVLYFMGQLEL